MKNSALIGLLLFALTPAISLCAQDEAVPMKGNWYWMTRLQSVRTFDRGGDLTVTYKMWVDPNSPSGDQFPDGVGLPGPWWRGDIPLSPDGSDAGFGSHWANENTNQVEAIICGAIGWDPSSGRYFWGAERAANGPMSVGS